MQKQTWMVLSIVLGILLILTITLIVVMFNLGMNEIKAESKCVDYCTSLGATTYNYDSYIETCNCYDEYGYIITPKDLTGKNHMLVPEAYSDEYK